MRRIGKPAAIWNIICLLTFYRFTGPKVNIEHMMLGREGNLIDGRVQPTEGDGRGSSEASSGGDDNLKSKMEADGKSATLV